MAVNGVTESFIASVATTADLARQSRAMIMFSIIFVGVSYGLLKVLGMGGEGLVWANCINLGVRIIWSCTFIGKWYERSGASVGWSRVLLSPGTIVSCVIIGLGMRIANEMRFNGWLRVIVIAFVGGLSLVGCMYDLLL
jgi:oligosaccharide translocation protein RFT1